MIASIILFQLILRLWKRIFLSLMISTVEIQFLLSVKIIFTVLILVTHRSAIFLIKPSIVVHRQPILRRLLLLDLTIMMKKKELGRKGFITGLLEINVMGV